MQRLTVTIHIIALSLLIGGLSCDNPQNKGAGDDFNIVLITVDTLRADHLSCYGYHRNTSPNIDNIAREGILFTNAIATSSWTPPSMASIMTSLHPMSHNVRHGLIKSDKVYDQEILHEQFDTLAEILKKNGYTTFGAVANLHMAKELGFGQGFDYYHCKGFDDAPVLLEVLSAWENKIRNAGKYFLWVHYFDPHFPYNPRIPWIKEYTAGLETGNEHIAAMEWKELVTHIAASRDQKNDLDNLIALYDSEINYADSYIGELVRKLAIDKNTLIIITSDHGEEFLDHGSLGHGRTLYQESIRVPLIISLPVLSKEPMNNIREEHVSILDIMPTILEILDITPPPQTAGKNLFDDKYALRLDKNNYVLSELSRWHILNSITKANWKYIYNTCTQQGELYNISSDRKERDNLVNQEAATAGILKQELFNWASTVTTDPSLRKTIETGKENIEKLKDLGYVSSGEPEEPKLKIEGCNLGVCHLSAQ